MRSRAFTESVVEDAALECRRPEGSIARAQARVIDFDDPDNDDWLAVNQFMVNENKHVRRSKGVLLFEGLSNAR